MEDLVSKSEIEGQLKPFILSSFKTSDAEWQRIVRNEASRRRINYFYLRRLLLGWRQSASSFNNEVEQTYDGIWSSYDLTRDLMPDRNTLAMQWADCGYLGNPTATQKIHLLAMLRLIQKVKPKSVLEVGSGHGLNMAILAGLCPDVEFHGVELTGSGVRATNALVSAAALPAAVIGFSPLPPVSATAYKRIKVQQGSAARLPFPDRSFDLVMTRLALEQMEALRHSALSEIARVAKSHTLMVEPFRDVNADGARRKYMVGHNYFQARINDLKGYGLYPFVVFHDWPHKAFHKAALVACKVMA